MADLGATVFSYVIPSNREALEYALERLTLEHFRSDSDGGVQRTFWKVLSDFGERYGDVFPAQHLTNLLERHGVDPTKVLLFSETYERYASTEVSEAAFRFAVDALCERRDAFDTGNAITTAYEILEDGRDVDGVLLKGDRAARQHLLQHLAAIDERSVVEDAPEGDLRAEGARILSMYAERASGSGETPGILSGIPSLDQVTNGIQPGEFGILAAYTNEGKSQWLAQWAWTACVEQGKNVFFATSETVRDTTIRRILSRHSRLPRFGFPQGLNAKAIQNGTLTREQREVFEAVVNDFTTNPDIGLCHISQIPRNATMNFIDQRASRINRIHRLDLALIDYLQLLHPHGRYGNEREGYNEILRDCKVWSTSFDKGRGLAVISPWQIRQPDYKTALTTMGYTLASLADTSEAEKTPDLIFSILRPSPTAQEGVVQILKARDGPTLPPSPVHLDYRSSYIGATPSMSVEASALEGDFGLAEILGAGA